MRLSRLLATLSLIAVPLAASAQDLTVSAAASLTNAFKDVGAQFEKANPGVSVKLNFAASGALLRQIEQGAPVDVFASADQATMDRGDKQGLIDAATRRDFAANSLVLIEPVQGGAQVRALKDLADGKITRVAVGKVDTVPVGRYTKQALESAGLWSTLQPKLVFADNVRQVLDYVSRGEVDAGFVYRTDAAIMRDKVKIVLTAQGHDPVSYPAAVIKESRNKKLAAKFLDYLATPEAGKILEQYGFGKP